MERRLGIAGELEGLQLGGDGEGEEAEQDPPERREPDPFQRTTRLAGAPAADGPAPACRPGRRGSFGRPPSALAQAREVGLAEARE